MLNIIAAALAQALHPGTMLPPEARARFHVGKGYPNPRRNWKAKRNQVRYLRGKRKKRK